MEEREIDLIDMIAEVLSHWRGILVAMVVGAVLLGAFSYLKSYQSVENVQTMEDLSPEERLVELEDTLKETQKVAVLTVIDDEAEYALKEKYVENSVIMQIDPFQVSRRELFYKLQVEDMGQSYILGSAYEDLINNVELYQWVEEHTGIPAVNARELISGDAKSNVLILNGAQETTVGNDSMKVIVYHADEKECERLAQAVKAYLEDRQEQLADDFGAHEMTLLSEATGIIMDTGILDKQIASNNTLLTLLNNIAKTKDAFTADQQEYYELLTQENIGEEAEMEEEQTDILTPTVSKKYILLGAFLFAFAYAGIFFIIYILNGKLRASDELQGIYHISQMGLIVKDSKKKFIVDKWIEALRNRGKRQFTREQSIELATIAVKIAVAKNGLNSICLMGCDLKAGADEICNRLKDALEKEQISVTILDNVLYDAAAMEKLENVKGVVLVEKAASTMYQEIADELELAARQEISVLGGIVVA